MALREKMINVTGTLLLRKFPCETNMLRDTGENLWNLQASWKRQQCIKSGSVYSGS
jgi:hypothetical protein